MRNSWVWALRLISSPSSSTLELEARLEVQSDGFLLTFEVSGADVDRISLQPKSSKPARKNDLWKETCFECFFGVGGTKQYFEFNGSTSGDWALYSFDDYRKGMKDAPVSGDPVMKKLEKVNGKLECVWQIPYFTKAILQGASLTAVIKMGENVSYWALKHAGEKPDFHLRESFVFRFF